MAQDYRRPVRIFEIAKRRKPSPVGVSAPSDFELGRTTTIDYVPNGPEIVPYCINAQTERLLCTLVTDVPAALAAPFLYQAQYEKAQGIVSIPFERLSELTEGTECEPTFVFSIGRCGSTLVSALLKAVDQRPASEPDVYSQIANLGADARALMGQPGVANLLRHTTLALARVCGRELFVKLRSQCNGIATELMATIPEARCAYMLREPQSWARSRHRTFGDDPATMAHMLKWGVQTYDALVSAGARPALVWYEDVAARPQRALTDLGVAADRVARLTPEAVAAVMSQDAQEGTGISRSDGTTRQLSAEGLRQFIEEWERIMPKEIIARHGLERLEPRGSQANERVARFPGPDAGRPPIALVAGGAAQ